MTIFIFIKHLLQRLNKGIHVYGKSLGSVLTAEREEFVKFVAEEDRSCFVESIDFYFDCELNS